MENLALIDSFSEFKDNKLIDRVTLMAILEDVFRNALKKIPLDFSAQYKLFLLVQQWQIAGMQILYSSLSENSSEASLQ